MQDGQEDRPLDVALEAASSQKLLDGLLASVLVARRRCKISAGPMRRAAMAGSCPWTWAESSSTDWDRRVPEARKGIESARPAGS